MRELALTLIPVIDNQRVIGILRRVHVLRLTSTRSNALVKDLMDEPTIVFKVNEDLITSVKVMLEFDEWYVPVVDNNNRYIGMVSLDNFLRNVLHKQKKLVNIGVSASDIMTGEVKFVLPDDRVSKVWRNMILYRISGYPVINSTREMKVIGIITQHDLLKKGYTRIELESEGGPKRGTRVRDAMTTPAITVNPETKIIPIIQTMIEKGIGRLPVTDDKGKLIGIVDRFDVSKALIESKIIS